MTALITAKSARLDLFAIRCRDLRDRVGSGSITFVDAVDMSYSAAVWSGLADDVGDDAVQQVMALAFGTIEVEAA
jgi:thiamine pyrophosphate-dependent acetolactate synthase large subunit-like protein